MYRLPDGIHCDAFGKIQLGVDGLPEIARETGGPVPATVVIVPFETLRMR